MQKQRRGLKGIFSLGLGILNAKQEQPGNFSPMGWSYRNLAPTRNDVFEGEKTPGEMGAAINYSLLYDRLRIRSWQAYLESEVAQIILNKYILWVVGSGLKLQHEPDAAVLAMEGIELNKELSAKVQARFNLWKTTTEADASKMSDLDDHAASAFKTAIIGGDCLVVNRVKNGAVEMQVIDGANVSTPIFQKDLVQAAAGRNNRIEYGVEIDRNNKHVAYYVATATGKHVRVPRRGPKTGVLMAYMVYGSKYRADSVRGLPLLSASLETLKKLDRYKEATVGSAEERQKIAFAVEHTADSTGENPLLAKVAQSGALGMGEATESKSTDGYEAAATKIATTTQKQAFNMPVGASLKLLESKNELFFKDFYNTNIQVLAASVNIPFEVAMSMYNSNYSASRAAIKDWEHSLKTKRVYFSKQFYKPYFALWFDVEVLNNKIQAPGYLQAGMDGNVMVLEAYRSARWLGANVPNIDPVKEVAAARMRLGDQTTPLTSYDQETEGLGTGDFTQITNKVKEEKKLIPEIKNADNGQATK